MKLRFSNKQSNAFTLTEMLLVLAVIGILAAVLLPAIRPHQRDHIASQRIICVNNLKEIGLGFRVWIGDCGDRYPTQVRADQGGAMELLVTGNVAAVFMVMSNELTTPKLLVCPADTGRHRATSFTNAFGNENVSYFVGLDAADVNPQSLLIGDDNFAISGVPVKSGVLPILTNTPISWTGERHKFGGNIGFADGSVQQLTTSRLTNAISKQFESGSGNPTNRIAIP